MDGEEVVVVVVVVVVVEVKLLKGVMGIMMFGRDPTVGTETFKGILETDDDGDEGGLKILRLLFKLLLLALGSRVGRSKGFIPFPSD